MGRGNMGRGNGSVVRATRMCGDQVLVWGTEEFGDEGERLGFNKQYCEGFVKGSALSYISHWWPC